MAGSLHWQLTISVYIFYGMATYGKIGEFIESEET